MTRPQRPTWSGAQPPAHLDGLSDPAVMKAIADSPTTLIRVVMLVSRGKGIVNDDKGTAYPVLRKRHCEVVPDGGPEAAAFDELMLGAMGARTGMIEPLPLPPGGEFVPARDDDDQEDL